MALSHGAPSRRNQRAVPARRENPGLKPMTLRVMAQPPDLSLPNNHNRETAGLFLPAVFVLN